MKSGMIVLLLTPIILMYELSFSTASLEAKTAENLDSQVHVLEFSKAIPGQLNYQGYLANAADSSVITATLEMTFRLFDSKTKGSELWSEIHPTVEVNNGLFQVLLGSFTPFPEGLFDGSELWLQTEVGPEVLAPRKPLVSVAYSQMTGEADHAVTADHATTADQAAEAQHAVHADTADYSPSAGAWTVNGDNVYRETGNVGIGTSAPSQKLDVVGTVQATGFRMPTGASDSYVLTSDSSGVATWQAVSGGAGGDITSVEAGTGLSGGGTTGDVTLDVEIPLELSGSVSGTEAVITGTNTGSGNGLEGSSTSNYGVYGTSTDGIGVMGECPDGVGLAGYSTSGKAVMGNCLNGYAGYFQGDAYISGNVGIGIGFPSSKLDVYGDINAGYTMSEASYKITGSTVLSVEGDDNTFVGVGAGENNSGWSVTFLGENAGHDNQGYGNTFLGVDAGLANTTGSWNAFLRHCGR